MQIKKYVGVAYLFITRIPTFYTNTEFKEKNFVESLSVYHWMDGINLT